MRYVPSAIGTHAPRSPVAPDGIDWFILIYETADAETQERLSCGLKAFGSIIVQTEETQGEYVVIIECPGTVPVLAMHELVMSIDHDAALIDTHASRSMAVRPPSVAARSAGLNPSGATLA